MAASESMGLYHLLTEIFLLLDDGDSRMLRPYDLSIAQFNALRHLERCQGRTINELSHLLICDKSNATRLVDRLERGGLVVRQQDANDRRYVRVCLTEAGQRLRDDAVAAHRASVGERLAALSSAERAELDALLQRVRGNLRALLDREDVTRPAAGTIRTTTEAMLADRARAGTCGDERTE